MKIIINNLAILEAAAQGLEHPALKLKNGKAYVRYDTITITDGAAYFSYRGSRIGAVYHPDIYRKGADLNLSGLSGKMRIKVN